MKYRLIGWVSGTYGTMKVDESFSAVDDNEAKKKSKIIIKKRRDFPTYNGSRFELCKSVCMFGKRENSNFDFRKLKF